MRFGVAIDLHARASAAADVGWPVVRDQVLLAEQLGFDLIVLPDHLAYRAGGDGDYAVPDEAVGARESTTVAAALAAVTERITIGHSVVNAVYRSPALLAHLAVTIADIAPGRYSLGVGVGNSFDYDQLGVAADHRVARFAEAVQIVHGLLHAGFADVDGDHWGADRAELPLRAPDVVIPLVVAAGGRRTMRLAAAYADAWNGFVPTDPSGEQLRRLLDGLADACAAVGRGDDLERTVDVVVDPLDRAGARDRSLGTLRAIVEAGIDEVRMYPLSDDTPAGRSEAIRAARDLVAAL